MRIIHLLTLISLLCLVSAKYLPDESNSRALLRNKRSIVDESGDTIENQSNESNDDNDSDDDGDNDSSELKKQEDAEKLQRKYAEKERKLQEKREKEERKIEEQLEKEHKKKQKLEAKFEEEQRKLQERMEKEKRKREEKLAKEESKRAEKIAKEEQKAQKEKSKQLKELEKKTLETANKQSDSSESGEDLDFDDIWKNYIYQKYGLTENSTDLDKDAAIKSYLQQEIGLNANSTRAEYRQAVLQLVQSKLAGNSTSQSSFKNYFVSQVNSIIIQKLQADITDKIAELDNDTALLENVTLPWAPQAKQAIGEERTILTAIAQFLSDVIPTWITGGKPSSSSSTTPSSISNNDVLETDSSNNSFVPNDNGGSSSTATSEANNIQPVNVGDNIATESVDSANPGIAAIDSTNPGIAAIPTDSNTLASTDNGSSLDSSSLNTNSATSSVDVVSSDAGNSNVNILTDSTNNLNENSPISQSAGSQSPENNSGSAVSDTSSPVIVEGSTDLLPINGPDNNNPSVDATSDNSQVIGTGPSEISNGIVTSSVSSPTLSNVASSTSPLTISTDSQSAGADISSLASPSAESSTSINNISTGTEAISGSVTSNADVNAPVSNDNISGVNVGTQAVVEGSVSDSLSGSETSENTVAASTDIVGNGPAVETESSVVLPLAPGLDASVVEQSSGANILETASIDSTSSNTAINDANSINSEVSVTPVSDTISTGEETAAPVLPSTASSTSAASDATLSNVDVSAISQVTASTGPETTAENSIISSHANEPVNIATNPSSLTVDANIPEAEPAVAASSDISITGTSETGISDTVTSITTSSNTNTVNVEGVPSASTGTDTVPAADVNPASVPISSVVVESTGISTAIPDVTGSSNVDVLVDATSSDSGPSDSSNVILASSSITTPVDSPIDLSAPNGNTISGETAANVVAASTEIPVNTNNTVVTSGAEESIINISDVVATTTEVIVNAVNEIVTSIQGTAAEAPEVPTTGLEVANSITSNAVDTASANTEGTTNVNDSILVDNASITSENVPLGPSEVVADTTILVQTPAPSAGIEATVAATVTSNAVDTASANTEGTTNVNDSTLVDNASVTSENVPLAPSEVVADTTIFVQTPAPLAGIEATVAATVVSEPSNVNVSVVTEGLPAAPIDTVPIVVVSNTIPSVDSTSSNTVVPATTDVLEPVPVVVETPVSLAPVEVTTAVSDINVISISSDGSPATSNNVELPAVAPVNDLSASSSDVTSAIGSEALGTDAGLSTTEQIPVAQNIITPAIPEEIGATVLEVTQQ